MPTNNSWNNSITAADVTLNGGVTSIGTDAASNAINIGTGAASKALTFGNTTGATSVTVNTGTGDFTLNSASGVIISALDTGEITYPLQSAFSAYLNATALNKTGNGGGYKLGDDALTEIFDQNSDFNVNGTFTAPITGRYRISGLAVGTGCTIATKIVGALTTSNRFYQTEGNLRPASNNDIGINFSFLVDMDAADTATYAIVITGEAGNTVDIAGNATNVYTGIQGNLVC
jgi:hypothetical protein